ncbi:MAG: GntR family transcriptional regulator [Lautropia sp.]
MKTTDPPTRRRSARLPERIYREVHERIARGELDPAERLTETRLADLLGVSRTPVREALLRLRREGLLEGPARAPVVAALTPADLEEIMEVRLLVEPYITARVAERATPDDVARLEASWQRELQAVTQRSSQQFTMANHDFRVLLLDLAGNSRLAEIARRYDSQIQTLRRLTLRGATNRRTVVAAHRRIVDAIARGDRSAAQAGMQELLTNARTAVLATAARHRKGPPRGRET